MLSVRVICKFILFLMDVKFASFIDMSRLHHTRPGKQMPSPSKAPRLAALGGNDGLFTNEAVVEVPVRESTPSTAASYQAIESDIRDHRPFIVSRGDGFVGATFIVSMITNIFQSHYRGPLMFDFLKFQYVFEIYGLRNLV